MNATVKVEHADKAFGAFQALKNVSLEAPQGEITGLIGNNGSGKTVLLKCIVGLMYVTGGQITVFDKTIGKDVDFRVHVALPQGGERLIARAAEANDRIAF